MEEIVPKDSRYVPIPQQPSCCCPACISMIMYKNNIPLVPQELLGYHLGLIVREEDKHLYWNPRDGVKPPSGYGTQIYRPEYHPDVAFKTLNIPLKMTYHSVNDFADTENLVDFISEKIADNADLMACFNHERLNGSHHGGHLCVIDIVDNGMIRLVDPQRDEPKWHNVNAEDLLDAMKIHGQEKMGGIWEFKKV